MPELLPNVATLGERVAPRPEAEPAPRAHWCTNIAQAGKEIGFHKLGFTDASPFQGRDAVLKRWLDSNFHGELSYMASERTDPQNLLRGAKSMIVVALAHAKPQALDPARPNVAGYAGGADYHGVLKRKLRQLAQRCADISGQPLTARACVDTAPLLEREAAARAGLSFTGKSSLSIVPGIGSYVLLGELLLDLELPHAAGALSGCGSCTRCLDACPTQAFVSEYVLDARRCISYLTIEYRGVIPRALRPGIGSHVFGCDICQRVCPYNDSKKRPAPAPELVQPESLLELSLLQLLQLGSGAHKRLVRGTALSRTSRPCLQRNAAVALGNSGDRRAVPALSESLKGKNELVRRHVAWALGRLGGAAARAALQQALQSESAPGVVEELELALQDCAD